MSSPIYKAKGKRENLPFEIHRNYDIYIEMERQFTTVETLSYWREFYDRARRPDSAKNSGTTSRLRRRLKKYDTGAFAGVIYYLVCMNASQPSLMHSNNPSTQCLMHCRIIVITRLSCIKLLLSTSLWSFSMFETSVGNDRRFWKDMIASIDVNTNLDSSTNRYLRNDLEEEHKIMQIPKLIYKKC